MTRREGAILGTEAKTRFRIAHATGKWPQAAKDCVSQLGPAPGSANLGFVYVTDVLADDFPSILTFLRSRTGIEDWVGTIGVGVCATGTEYFDVPAIAVMTAELAPDSYRVFPAISADMGGFRRTACDWIAVHHPKLGLVHGDPRNPRIPALVCELAEAASAFLVGGLTSSRRGFDQVAGDITQGGISGVLFGSDVAVATGLTQGCRPIGAVHTVTAGFGNVLAELDGQEALTVLAKDAGEEITENFAERIAAIEAAFPVEASDTGDYMVRNLIGIDAERGLLVIGEKVAIGDKIMFVRRGEEEAVTDMAQMLSQLRRRIADPPKAGIYVACVGRGPAIFSPANRELDLIRKEFGSFPLIGFSANGEICNNRLYGYTGVLALFL
jgi:small ligand-binding sensory domain FIST